MLNLPVPSLKLLAQEEDLANHLGRRHIVDTLVVAPAGKRPRVAGSRLLMHSDGAVHLLGPVNGNLDRGLQITRGHASIEHALVTVLVRARMETLHCGAILLEVAGGLGTS